MDLFDRIAAAQERWDVLRHPFYVRWSAGELTREELGFYAGEYRHAVVALAEATAAAARAAEPAVRAELEEHAAEEAAHVALWDDFAAAVGGARERDPRAETAACAAAWTAGAGLDDHLAVLLAVESAQPAVSATKLEGLTLHYGLRAGEPGTAYFELHAERDHDHAAHSRALLAGRAGDGSAAAGAAAEAALAANWRLLDGVEDRFGR